MTDLYVGGIGFKHHYKTLDAAISNSRANDVIHLTKNAILHTADIPHPLTIDGGNNAITISNGDGGLRASAYRLTVKNTTFNCDTGCNAIQMQAENSTLVLNNIKIKYVKKSDPRDWYPSIYLKESDSLIAVNLETQYIDIVCQAIDLTNCKIGSIFTTGSHLDASSVSIHNTELTNTYINADQGDFKDIKTYGSLTFDHVKGDLTDITFEFNTNPVKKYRKLFKDTAFIKDTIIFLNIINDSDIKLTNIQETPYPENQEPSYAWSAFIINNSTITLENSNFTLDKYMSKATDSKIQLLSGDRPEITLINSEIIETQTTGSGESDDYKKLQEMIGLTSVKAQLNKMLDVAKMNAKRKEQGLDSDTSFNMNMVFGGAPGTGKTTVAKKFGKILYQEHVLPTDKFLVTTRKDFVSKYVGETAQKAHAVMESARGGVLLIDEAYSLMPHGDQDHAQEAVDQIVMDITEMKGELVVILAGYTEPMHDFLDKANVGLNRRFPTWVEFPSYTCDELLDILLLNINTKQIDMSQDDFDYMEDLFIALYNQDATEDGLDGNGGYIENLMRDLLSARDSRLSKLSREGVELSKQDLITITRADIDTVFNARLHK